MSDRRRPMGGVLSGMLRVARGRADGIACFGGTAQSYLTSLAPLVAFPLVGTLLRIASWGSGMTGEGHGGSIADGPRQALTDLLMTLCAVIAPAVLSYEIARAWKREREWFRYATAFNWCEWILPVVAMLAMVPVSIAIGAGMRKAVAGGLFLLFLGFYGLWLHWFLARNALSLSGGRAALLVLLVNAGTAALVIGPSLFGPDRE